MSSLGLTPAGATAPRQVVTHLGPDRHGGGGIASVLRTYASMDLDGHRFVFMATWHPAARLWGLRPFVAALIRLVVTPTAVLGLCHFHMSQGGSFVREGLLVGVARLRRLPIVVTIHGPTFEQFLDRHPALVRTVLGQAAVVGVLTRDVERRLGSALAATRVLLLPNPVDLPALTTSAATRPATALFAAEVSTRKGVDVLVAAWCRVGAVVPGARLLIAGPPGDVPPRALTGVEWLGPVPNDRVVRLLDQARAAVLPSRAEAMPVFLLEALAAGRPIVTTPAGAGAALADGAGLVVPIGDPDALADALVAVLTDDDFVERAGRVGRTRVEQEHASPVVAELLEAVYQGVRA